MASPRMNWRCPARTINTTGSGDHGGLLQLDRNLLEEADCAFKELRLLERITIIVQRRLELEHRRVFRHPIMRFEAAQHHPHKGEEEHAQRQAKSERAAACEAGGAATGNARHAGPGEASPG
jgi:hypothetical protein